ncbi:MAG TPA: glucose-1-phosphate cytidylyltransferase [Coleofasciculaceae cyanobacterium]|jgi:glucose-1-phosphate cytidylyltransferase
MKVVILCGGQGTRLREETEFRPKPMVEIGGKPILWHIMKLYSHYGIRDFILCLGYKAQLIKEYFLNYEPMNNDFTIHLGKRQNVIFHSKHDEQDFQVTLVDTGVDAMTGARVKAIERFIDDDEFMVTYGDGLSDVNIGQLIAFHRSHNKIATVTTVQPTSRYGLVEINDADEITRFAEKPRSRNWISAGFFVFNRAVFDYLSPDKNCILEQTPLYNLAQERQLAAYRHDGFFYAMDTYREFLHLSELWESGSAPWYVWDQEEKEQEAASSALSLSDNKNLALAIEEII